jgi:hypothetical protein
MFIQVLMCQYSIQENSRTSSKQIDFDVEVERVTDTLPFSFIRFEAIKYQNYVLG